MVWHKMGHGSFNTAYRNDSSTLVLKIQQDSSDSTDTPDRSVRLWNEINPDIPPPARTLNVPKLGKGWVCPFVTGVQSSDDEMAEAVVKIFNRTGRIVVDAISPKNFITTDAGQVICIDIGMALQMDKREDETFESSRRRKSIVSLQAWNDLQDAYIPYFERGMQHSLKTISTVKALIFIKATRPDIYDASFLLSQPETVRLLAAAYDSKNSRVQDSALRKLDKLSTDISSDIEAKSFQVETPPDVRAGRELLKEERPITLKNIKESCILEIRRYIEARGTLHENNFIPSLITYFFRNLSAVNAKVDLAKDAIEKIESADSLLDIKFIVSDALAKTPSGVFGSSLAKSLQCCDLMVETGLKEELKEVMRHSPT